MFGLGLDVVILALAVASPGRLAASTPITGKIATVVATLVLGVTGLVFLAALVFS